jgi:hypothetical protein
MAKYLHLLYALVTCVAFFPFFVLGWVFAEIQMGFKTGMQQCSRYNTGPLQRGINQIARGTHDRRNQSTTDRTEDRRRYR